MGAESGWGGLFLSFLDVEEEEEFTDSVLPKRGWSEKEGGLAGLRLEKGEGGVEEGERVGEEKRVWEGGGKGKDPSSLSSSSSSSSSPSPYTDDRSLNPVPLFALLIGPPSFASSFFTFWTCPAGGEEIFLWSFFGDPSDC